MVNEWNTIYECQGAFRDLKRLIKEISDRLKNNNEDWNEISAEQLGLLAVYAAREGCINILKWISHKGGSFTVQNQAGYTALHHAAEKNRFEIVKWLVKHGAKIEAKVNIRTKMGEEMTILHCAAFGGSVEIMKFLLDHGALSDLDLQSYLGCTVLHYAVLGGHQNMIDFLISVGANAAIKDYTGDVYLDMEQPL